MRTTVSAFVLLGVACCAQTTDEKLTFEVASVRVVVDLTTRAVPIGHRGGPGTNDPERMTDGHATLQSLLMYAYDLDKFRVFGPGWTTSDRYDVVAKVPPGATVEQAKVMMQNLIKERFDCRVHFEKRNISVYELTIAKNGPKLTRSLPASPATAADAADANGPITYENGPITYENGPITYELDKDDLPRLPPSGRPILITGGGPAAMVAGRRQPLSSLITFLQGRLNMMVVDKTGLVDTYDFALKFAFPGVAQQPSDQNAVGAAQEPAPDVVTALKKYLGLKLEEKKVPLDVLVIDHAERTPTEN